MIKYEAQITAIGESIAEFVDAGILVFFGQEAPSELAEFAILHDGHGLSEPLAPGDRIRLDKNVFAVLAVGAVASSNLAELGHLVVKFNGQHEPEMPGDVCVEAKPVPALTVGMHFAIEPGPPEG